MHICIVSDITTSAKATQPDQNGNTDTDTDALEPNNCYLQSNDLINHPSNQVGVSMAAELSEWATWTCTDSSIMAPSVSPSTDTLLSPSRSALSSLVGSSLFGRSHDSSASTNSTSRVTTKLFQDYRGEYLNCSQAGQLYLSPIATHESHWQVHKRKTCQLIESYAYKSWLLASNPDTFHVYIYDATAEVRQTGGIAPHAPPTATPATPIVTVGSHASTPPKLEDLIPAVRWKVCFAVIQGELMKRSTIETPREMTPPAADGDLAHGGDSSRSVDSRSRSGVDSPAPVYVSRFWWVSPSGLSYWHTAIDVHPLPPVRTYPYGEMVHILVDAARPCRFDIVIKATGEKVELLAETPWQKEIWVQAIVNKGVTLYAHAQTLKE